jgi:hypothetical protein
MASKQAATSTSSVPQSLPDFEALNTQFSAYVQSLIPASFVTVSKPPLDVDKIVKEEKERRDRLRRKKEQREREEAMANGADA